MEEPTERDCCCLKLMKTVQDSSSRSNLDHRTIEARNNDMLKAMTEAFKSERFLRSLKGEEGQQVENDDACKIDEQSKDDVEDIDEEHQSMADAVRGKPDYCCPNTNPERAPMKDVPKSFYEARATLLGGRDVTMKEICEGKVTIVVNTASFCGLTVTEYTQMNELIDKFPPEKFVILAFPCNQFCFEENAWGKDEILNMLKHVRPGKGYVPKAVMFERCDVNGASAHPLYEFLKRELPCAEDEPFHIIRNEAMLYWDPIFRYDIASNFEKFLIDQCGRVLHRYSPMYQIRCLGDEVCKLLQNNAQDKSESQETIIERALTRLHDEDSDSEIPEILADEKSPENASDSKLEADEEEDETSSKTDVTEESQSMESDSEESQEEDMNTSTQQAEVETLDAHEETVQPAQQAMLSSVQSFSHSRMPFCYSYCCRNACSYGRAVQRTCQRCTSRPHHAPSTQLRAYTNCQGFPGMCNAGQQAGCQRQNGGLPVFHSMQTRLGQPPSGYAMQQFQDPSMGFNAQPYDQMRRHRRLLADVEADVHQQNIQESRGLLKNRSLEQVIQKLRRERAKRSRREQTTLASAFRSRDDDDHSEDEIRPVSPRQQRRPY